MLVPLAFFTAVISHARPILPYPTPPSQTLPNICYATYICSCRRLFRNETSAASFCRSTCGLTSRSSTRQVPIVCSLPCSSSSSSRLRSPRWPPAAPSRIRTYRKKRRWIASVSTTPRLARRYRRSPCCPKCFVWRKPSEGRCENTKQGVFWFWASLAHSTAVLFSTGSFVQGSPLGVGIMASHGRCKDKRQPSFVKDCCF